MEYSPPPLFKQGASARVKVVFFALLSFALLMVDARLRSLTVIRQAVGAGLYPFQTVALLPRDAAYMVGDYFSSLSALQKENKRLKQRQVENAQSLQEVQQLAAENAHLRQLLEANERVPVKTLMAEILYDARDPFTRKIVMDRGTQHGVMLGQPVIDDVGVVGQVTRVFPFTSEVTLLTDKDLAIPVQVVRSGLRSIAYGQGSSGSLDLRFMPANADVKNGDILVTSGIDGVYPPGLAVAKVVNVEQKSSDAFARIACQPLAGIDRNRQLLILLNEQKLPPRPEPEDHLKKDGKGKKRPAETAKDAPKEAAVNPSTPLRTETSANAAPSAPAPAAAPVKPALINPAATAPVKAAPVNSASPNAVPATTTAPKAASNHAAPANLAPAAPAPAKTAPVSAVPASPAPAAAPVRAVPANVVPAHPAPVTPASSRAPAADAGPVRSPAQENMPPQQPQNTVPKVSAP